MAHVGLIRPSASSPYKATETWSRSTTEISGLPDIQPDNVSEDHAEASEDCIYPASFKFPHITGEFDVRFFTAIPRTETLGDLWLKKKHM